MSCFTPFFFIIVFIIILGLRPKPMNSFVRPIWPILRHDFKPTGHQLPSPVQACFSTRFHARPTKPFGLQGRPQLLHSLLASCSFFSRASSRELSPTSLYVSLVFSLTKQHHATLAPCTSPANPHARSPTCFSMGTFCLSSAPSEPDERSRHTNKHGRPAFLLFPM